MTSAKNIYLFTTNTNIADVWHATRPNTSWPVGLRRYEGGETGLRTRRHEPRNGIGIRNETWGYPLFIP